MPFELFKRSDHGGAAARRADPAARVSRDGRINLNMSARIMVGDMGHVQLAVDPDDQAIALIPVPPKNSESVYVVGRPNAYACVISAHALVKSYAVSPGKYRLAEGTVLGKPAFLFHYIRTDVRTTK